MSKKDYRVEVSSSHGKLTIDARTGVVLKCITFAPRGDKDADHLLSIVAFDVDEHYKYWGTNPHTVPGFDILDLGYTFVMPNGTPSYEEPAHDWREEIPGRIPVSKQTVAKVNWKEID